MNEEYVKSVEDELDWKLLDQLHGAVSQISGFCFEIKKFCVVTTFVVLTLLVKFTSNSLDNSLFITGLIVPICFWFLDSVGYYYQVKLRGTMEALRQKIQTKNPENIVSHSGISIIANDRVNKHQAILVRNSCLNHSMWIYVIMVALDLIAWCLYLSGVIK